jgi:transposase InsO family protein
MGRGSVGATRAAPLLQHWRSDARRKKDKPEEIVAKLRDELLNGEIFYSLVEAKIVIESWRRHYNTRRPHSSLGYRPPAPEVISWPASPSGAASPATPSVAPRTVMH